MKNRNYVFEKRFTDIIKEQGGVAEVAKLLNKNRTTISYWANGRRIPEVENLKIISESFGVSADYLIGISNAKSLDIDVQSIAKVTGLSEKSIKILIGLNREKSKNIDTISKVVEAFAENE